MKKESNDKRSKLLDAALTLFTEKGFQDTSTSLISKTAGVATGTLFNYFQTKEALINELYRELKREAMNVLIGSLDPKENTTSIFKKIWMDFAIWGITNHKKIRFLQFFDSSPYITKITREEIMAMYIPFFDVMREGIENGVIRNMSVELAVVEISHALLGVIGYIINQEVIQNKEKVLSEAFDILWNGLANK